MRCARDIICTGLESFQDVIRWAGLEDRSIDFRGQSFASGFYVG